MNRKNIILFAICFLSFSVLWYGCVIWDMKHITWIMALSFWVLTFSLLLLLVRIFFKPNSNFYLAFFSITITIIMAEFTLRLLGIGAFYMEQRAGFYLSPFASIDHGWFRIWEPNAYHTLSNIEYNYPRNTNSLGVSDVEFDKNKKSNSIRIFSIGDSFTEGDGSPADSTWPKRLKENISKIYPGINFDVYNTGVCGSDPFFGYKLLQEKLIAYHPDMVIMTVNNSDIDDYMVRGGMERFRPDSTTKYRQHPRYEFPVALSYINRLWLKNILKLDYNLMTAQARKKLVPKALADITSVIKAADSLCTSNGSRFIVFFHPDKFEYKDGSYYVIQPIIDRINKESSIPNCDFLDFLIRDPQISKENINQYYWIIDGHHNSKGYMLMGDAITPKVISVLQPQLDSLQSIAQKNK